MRPRLDALTIPEGSSRYFSIDLNEWRRVQLEGAAAELAQLDGEIPALKEAMPAPGDDELTKAAWEVAAADLFKREHRHKSLTAMVQALEPIPKRDVHHFKSPVPSKGNAFARWADTSTDPGLSLYFAALVGLYWSHRGTEMDAKLPTRATSEQWDEYAEAVEDELQDAGYTSQEITLMGSQCDERLGAWLQGLTKAKAVADFTSPKGA